MKRVLIACLLALAGGLVLGVWHPAGAAACYGPCGGPAAITVVGVHQGANGVTTLDVRGTGYGSNETVQLSVFSPLRSVGTAHTSASGSFAIAVVLPAGYSAGTHTIEGTGTVSGRTASNTFFLPKATGAPQPCEASAVSAARFVLAACAISHLPASGSAPAGSSASVQAGHSLPFTGAAVAASVGGGAAAIGTGGLLVLASRRRRRSKWVG